MMSCSLSPGTLEYDEWIWNRWKYGNMMKRVEGFKLDLRCKSKTNVRFGLFISSHESGVIFSTSVIVFTLICLSFSFFFHPSAPSLTPWDSYGWQHVMTAGLKENTKKTISRSPDITDISLCLQKFMATTISWNNCRSELYIISAYVNKQQKNTKIKFVAKKMRWKIGKK